MCSANNPTVPKLANQIQLAIHSRIENRSRFFPSGRIQEGVQQLSNPDFSKQPQPPVEEPRIQREIDSDKTGIIRRYLRLADDLLKKSDDDSNSSAA
jgi:hypothetical protein